ncbi:hypothetical protein [Streptomyces sp. AM6-12]|uniref:hypothetical protein n=1 Tax=Streptomyces sp. AM6-12 TaxID=3345149 RepID=UPI00379BF246
MGDLVVAVLFGVLLSAPLWMTWGAGKLAGLCPRTRTRPGGGAEAVFIVLAAVLLFAVAAGLAVLSGV